MSDETAQWRAARMAQLSAAIERRTQQAFDYVIEAAAQRRADEIIELYSIAEARDRGVCLSLSLQELECMRWRVGSFQTG